MLAILALAVLFVSALRRRADGAWTFALLVPALGALTHSEVGGYLGIALPHLENVVIGLAVLAMLVVLLRARRGVRGWFTRQGA